MPVSATCGPTSGMPAELIDRPTSVLSGGEAARASLASLLLSRFDVFLLDEPTNDLDLDGLARLEEWVLGLRAGVVVVSHDRTFLERVVTDVVEIDFHTHRARRFGGGWSAFLAERELERQHAQERYDEFDTKRRTLLGRAQREREWASQGQAKLRTSGETDKHIRHFRMNQTEQLAGQGGADGAGDRATRRGRRAAHAVGTPPRHPARGPQRRSRGVRVAGDRRPGRLPARSGRRAAHARRTGGPRRCERCGEVDA